MIALDGHPGGIVMTRKSFRTAIIGAGLIANTAHLPAISLIGDAITVVGIADIRESAAQETAVRFNIPKVYTDSRIMLDDLKPDIVIVATPNGSHNDLSLLALRSGAHVICEKPVAIKYADVVGLFAEADKLGLHFFPAQTMRFFTDRLAVKKIIDSGLLGNIYYAYFDAVRRRGIPKWGFFHMKDFNVGGPFCDLAVHEIDFMLWTLGNPKAISVSGSSWMKIGNSGKELQTSAEQSGAFGGVQITPRPYDWKEFNVEDMTTGIIRLEGGIVINFNASWAVNLPERWERKYAGTDAGLIYGNNIPITILGDTCGWQAETKPMVFDENRFPPHIVFPGHVGLLRNIVGFLRGEEDIVIKKEETKNVTAIIEAFYSSAEAGKEIYCSSITN
jgi:predicted dehydrogenase